MSRRDDRNSFWGVPADIYKTVNVGEIKAQVEQLHAKTDDLLAVISSNSGIEMCKKLTDDAVVAQRRALQEQDTNIVTIACDVKAFAQQVSNVEVNAKAAKVHSEARVETILAKALELLSGAEGQQRE